MTRLFVLAALLPLAACQAIDSDPQVSRGDTEEIAVVTDSATWAGPVGEALRETLGRRVVTLPSNQGAFKLRLMPLTSQTFASIKRMPAVVIAGAIDAPGELGDFLRARVGEANLERVRSGTTAAVNVREDLWAAPQVVTIATGATDAELALQLLDRGDALRQSYAALARGRITGEMFARLRQTEKEDDLARRHGIRIGLQADYVQVQDTTATADGRPGDFVRYRRVLSDTWRDFFVFIEDGVTALPSQDELDRMTNDLLRQFAEGSIDSSYVQLEASRPVTRDTVEIGGRTALEQRGLWQTTLVPMGGGYVRYAMLDEASDRLLLYYGMTFAPSRRLDKRKFVRQMEAIGYTLRPASDPPPAAE